MTNNNNNNDIPFPFPPAFLNKDQIKYFKRVIPVTIYDFYIHGEITEAENYLDLFQTLKGADSQDTIFLYLNTVGGDLYTTVQILSAMNNSNAQIITCLEGQVCSAGTFIFLKGDTKIVNPDCTFMAHSYSHSPAGKGNEVFQHVSYMKEYFNKLCQNIYKNFLTFEEIEDVIKGNDMWLNSHEVVERLDSNEHDFIYTGDDLEFDVKVDVAVSPKNDKSIPVKKKTKKTRTTKEKTKTTD